MDVGRQARRVAVHPRIRGVWPEWGEEEDFRAG